MNRTSFLFALTLFLFLGGCEKKVDQKRFDEGTQLVAEGNYEKGIAILDGLGKDNPDDPALRKARVEAHLTYGKFLMYNDSLSPKEKYPGALRQFRAVLALDNGNSEARSNAEMIESIYRSMGRTIPQ